MGAKSVQWVTDILIHFLMSRWTSAPGQVLLKASLDEGNCSLITSRPQATGGVGTAGLWAQERRLFLGVLSSVRGRGILSQDNDLHPDF